MLPAWVFLWTVIPLAIFVDDGRPILFRQRRYGKNGRVFRFPKFRTMVKGAELDGLITRDVDPRTTRVGRILRRTAMDELPQVISILKGDMSFVGPRPLPDEMHDLARMEEPRFSERLQVVPGLTGLAQLYLPRHCPPRRRLRYDLLYIRRASLWLDFRLLALALWHTLTASWGKGLKRPQLDPETEKGLDRSQRNADDVGTG